MSDRPAPAQALYEVQVWNFDTSTSEWSMLTTGSGLAETVDAAEEFAVRYSADVEDHLLAVVANRA